MEIKEVFFWVFSFGVVFSSLMVIFQRRALSCAFFLIISFINMAGIFALLDAQFLAVAQILVYAGAILVLFTFVIMLLNMSTEDLGLFPMHRKQIPAVGTIFLVLASFISVIWAGNLGTAEKGAGLMPAVSDTYGNITEVARLMFTQYLVPFEIVSLLLLVATVGVVLLAKRVI